MFRIKMKRLFALLLLVTCSCMWRCVWAQVPAGYELVWSDEFKGRNIDTEKWTFAEWKKGRVNHELQAYVADGVTPKGARTARIKKGKLLITCLAEGEDILSARMYGNVNKGFKYGYFESRIRLPKGKGTWPAFWMMPVEGGRWPACGEIDILEEVGVDAGRVSSSIHCQAYNHPAKTQKTHEIYVESSESEFHVYSMEWTADYIHTFVDGQPQLVFENDGKGDPATWPFNKAFYPILNLAWGGDWGGYKGVDNSALPVTMEVDYVRIYQKK